MVNYQVLKNKLSYHLVLLFFGFWYHFNGSPRTTQANSVRCLWHIYPSLWDENKPTECSQKKLNILFSRAASYGTLFETVSQNLISKFPQNKLQNWSFFYLREQFRSFYLQVYLLNLHSSCLHCWSRNVPKNDPDVEDKHHNRAKSKNQDGHPAHKFREHLSLVFKSNWGMFGRARRCRRNLPVHPFTLKILDS